MSGRARPLWTQAGALMGLKQALLSGVNPALAKIRTDYAEDVAEGLRHVQPVDITCVVADFALQALTVDDYPYIHVSPTDRSQFGRRSALNQPVNWVFEVTILHRVYQSDDVAQHTETERGCADVLAYLDAIRIAILAPSTGVLCMDYGISAVQIQPYSLDVIEAEDDGDEIEVSGTLLVQLTQTTH